MKKYRLLPVIGLIAVVVSLMVSCSTMENLNPFSGSDKVVMAVDCGNLPPGQILMIKEAVMFDVDSAVVKVDQLHILDKVAKLMKENPDVDLAVNGFASIDGTTAYNQDLSTFRAEAVEDGLIERGITSDRINIIGKGETEQFGAIHSENRRVMVLSIDEM